MTETDWLESSDLRALLSHVRSGANLTRTKPGRRKMRLFACGCCRLVETLFPDDRTRQSLEVCEQYADGLVGEAEREVAKRWANQTAAREYARAEVKALAAGMEAARAVWSALDKDGRQAVEFALEFGIKAAQAASRTTAAKGQKGRDAEAAGWAMRARQCDLLRDLFGNPFRPVTFPAAWNTADVVGLATAIHQERAFDRMPVLGDALEEAACTDAAVLSHCRGGGPHFRGCWVVDAVLFGERPPGPGRATKPPGRAPRR